MEGRLTERAMETYKEVGFNGSFVMDYTLRFPEIRSRMGRLIACAVGYMHAMIQAVYGS